MKEQILKLHSEGKSYTQIAALIPCAISTVWYYCTKGAKDKRNSYKRRDGKNFRIEIKNRFGGKCQICGYNKCLDALDFHHLKSSTKSADVSSLSTSKKKALKEAAKCILICSNCHDEIHAGVTTIPVGLVALDGSAPSPIA